MWFGFPRDVGGLFLVWDRTDRFVATYMAEDPNPDKKYASKQVWWGIVWFWFPRDMGACLWRLLAPPPCSMHMQTSQRTYSSDFHPRVISMSAVFFFPFFVFCSGFVGHHQLSLEKRRPAFLSNCFLVFFVAVVVFFWFVLQRFRSPGERQREPLQTPGK